MRPYQVELFVELQRRQFHAGTTVFMEDVVDVGTTPVRGCIGGNNQSVACCKVLNAAANRL